MLVLPSEMSLGGMVVAAYRKDFIKLHVGIGSLICYEKDAIMKRSWIYWRDATDFYNVFPLVRTNGEISLSLQVQENLSFFSLD